MRLLSRCSTCSLNTCRKCCLPGSSEKNHTSYGNLAPAAWWHFQMGFWALTQAMSKQIYSDSAIVLKAWKEKTPIWGTYRSRYALPLFSTQFCSHRKEIPPFWWTHSAQAQQKQLPGSGALPGLTCRSARGRTKWTNAASRWFVHLQLFLHPLWTCPLSPGAGGGCGHPHCGRLSTRLQPPAPTLGIASVWVLIRSTESHPTSV